MIKKAPQKNNSLIRKYFYTQFSRVTGSKFLLSGAKDSKNREILSENGLLALLPPVSLILSYKKSYWQTTLLNMETQLLYLFFFFIIFMIMYLCLDELLEYKFHKGRLCISWTQLFVITLPDAGDISIQ